MGYRLYTDACCDLPIEYIEAHNLDVLPMMVTMEGKDFTIAADPSAPGAVDIQAFYNKLRQGIPATTTQIPEPMFVEVFEPVLAAGDDILYIAFSSGLSGTYDGACVAAHELKEKYPDRKLLVVDSLCASMGQGLLVHLCVQRREEGMDIDSLAQYAEANRQRIHHWVTVDDLSHLRRGGRVSGPMALLGTVLAVKPIILMDAEGKLIAVDKVQGRRRSLKHLVDKMDAEATRPITEAVFLSHADDAEGAKTVAELIRERFGVDVMLINTICPIVGCHCGPGTMALFFVSGEERKATI